MAVSKGKIKSKLQRRLGVKNSRTTHGNTKLEWLGGDVAVDNALKVSKALSVAMGVTRLRAGVNLSRISSASKWKKPGGFGHWKGIQRHGFLKDSIAVGDYITKEGLPGSYLILSSIGIPVEYGTRRGKRGWFKRGSNQYTTRLKKRTRIGATTTDYTGPRGPSKAKPFLKPAVRDSASTIRAALARGGRRSG